MSEVHRLDTYAPAGPPRKPIKVKSLDAFDKRKFVREADPDAIGRARDLLRLGFALEGHPEMEDWIRKGWLDFQRAYLLGDLYRAEARHAGAAESDLDPVFDPDDLKDEDGWMPCCWNSRDAGTAVMPEQPVPASSGSPGSGGRSAGSSSPCATRASGPGPSPRP